MIAMIMFLSELGSLLWKEFGSVLQGLIQFCLLRQHDAGAKQRFSGGDNSLVHAPFDELFELNE
jgi:hypothetical protein